jgi:hypothetical protein
VTAQPAEGSLHNPAAWKHIETLNLVGSFHDLQLEQVAGAQLGNPLDKFPGISPISPNEPDAPEAVAYPVEQQFGAVPILNVGPMDDYRNNQTQCVYQQMALAAVDFLAGIISMDPPFSVVLTDWLSMIAALGLASRPTAMRTSMCNVSWIRVQVPSRRQVEK